MNPSCSLVDASMQAGAVASSSGPLPNTREDRGRQIAKRGGIRRIGRRFAVPAQSAGGPATYLVDLVDDRCTCPDWELRRSRCKHAEAVLFWLAWEGDGGAPTETEAAKSPRRKYPRNWTAYNAAQKKEGLYIELLLRALCDGIPQPSRKPGPGRNPIPPRDAAFSAVMKVFSTKSQRRMQSDLADSVKNGNLDHVWHYNTIGNFFADRASTTLLVSLIEESAKPLAALESGQFAIDSTGFSVVTYDRWFDQKHGRLCAEHPWVKLHVMVGTCTHAITGVQVTPEADCPQLPELLAQTQKNFDVREVSADKAYSSKKNHRVLERCGVEAYIPFKVNAVFDPKCEAWSRHLAEFLFNQERFLPHYNRRSNVETVMSMLKMKFGASVRSRSPIAQMNEVLAKCLLHNLACLVQAIFAAGLAPRFWQDAAPSGLAKVIPLIPRPQSNLEVL